MVTATVLAKAAAAGTVADVEINLPSVKPDSTQGKPARVKRGIAWQR